MSKVDIENMKQFCKTHNFIFLEKIENYIIISLFIFYSSYCLEKNKGNIQLATDILNFYKVQIKYLIQTSDSFLSVRTIPFIKNIIDTCVIEIKDKLILNPKVIVFGKEGTQHRSIGFFSNESIGYHYSNQLAKSQQLTPSLKLLLQIINILYDSDFNGILINKYKDGSDNIGKHSDDEKGLSNIGVVAISYGAVRKFRIRDKKTDKIIQDIPTNPFELLHMGGKFQSHFTHEIPTEKKIKEERISFTFRKHLV
jgi:alkylated DNA repair dioxygenase AlkB